MFKVRKRYTLRRIMVMVGAMALTLGVSRTLSEPVLSALPVMVAIALIGTTEGYTFTEILARLNTGSPPARLRKHHSLPLTLGTIAAMVVPLALVKPQYAGVPFALMIALVVVIEGMTLTENLVLLAIGAVLSALLMPAVTPRCYRGPRPVPATPVSVSSDADIEPIMCLPDPEWPVPSGARIHR
jgi:hypothetical protein